MRVVTAVARRIIALHMGESSRRRADAVARDPKVVELTRTGLQSHEHHAFRRKLGRRLRRFQVLWGAESAWQWRNRRADGPNGAGKSRWVNTISGRCTRAQALSPSKPGASTACRPIAAQATALRCPTRPAPLSVPHVHDKRAHRRSQSAAPGRIATKTLERLEALLPLLKARRSQPRIRSPAASRDGGDRARLMARHEAYDDRRAFLGLALAHGARDRRVSAPHPRRAGHQVLSSSRTWSSRSGSPIAASCSNRAAGSQRFLGRAGAALLGSETFFLGDVAL